MITLPFQRKKEKTKPTPQKKELEKEVVKEKKKKNEPKIKPQKGVQLKKSIGKSKIAYRILKEPIISEKGTNLANQNKYIFKVFPEANKVEIQKAIEDIYKVKVKKVNIVNVRKKRKRVGRQEGWKPGYKKAIIFLEEGEKIETTPR